MTSIYIIYTFLSQLAKLAASFGDLAFFGPAMEAELDRAWAQIIELKAKLEYEHKARKKAETLSRRLAEELAEERRGRRALERVCEELARKISSEKSEIGRMKREMEKEREMLRMAEVFREERVQMKLAEAKLLFEEKLVELEGTKEKELIRKSVLEMEQMMQLHDKDRDEHKVPDFATASEAHANLSGKVSCRLVLGERSCDDASGAADSTTAVLNAKSSCNDHISGVSSIRMQRRKLPDPPENPHIKRGIKGFVEFPRVVQALGSKNRHWGTRLEWQKAQLKILMKQKCPIRSNNIIIS